MAAGRKLQAEIDRCLKKVSEGIELFEEVWTKVHNATSPNLKEKYETDLKKEIKKLQRLRDQIKTWIASGEIKDQTTLVETRKLIETQMERLKVVERERRTKAYSKEGLGLVTKADPITKERDELNTWLINTIDNMQMQIDSFESDIESLLVFKKKKVDKEKQEKLDMLEGVVEKHKFHVGKLEVILRTLDNIANEEKLPNFLTQVKKIKEDVEYYLDSAQDPEYEDNEFLYDDIECLDDLLGSGVGSSTITPTSTPILDVHHPRTPTPIIPIIGTIGNSPITYLLNHPILTVEKQQEFFRQQALDEQLGRERERALAERRRSYTEETASKIFKPLPMKPEQSGSVGYGAQVLSNNKVAGGYSTNTPPAMESGDGPKVYPYIPGSTIKYPTQPLVPEITEFVRLQKLARAQTPTPPPFVPVRVSTPKESLQSTSTYPSNGIAHTSHHQQQHQPRTQLPTSLDLSDTQNVEKELGVVHPKAVRSASPVVVRSEPEPIVTYTHPVVEKEQPEVLPTQPQVEEELVQEEEPQLPPQETQPQHSTVNNAPNMILTPSEQMLIEQYMSGSESNPLDSRLTSLKSMAQDVMTRAGLHFSAEQPPVSEETTSAHIPPLLGVAPLGPVPLHWKHDYQLAMLEAAHYHMPIQPDSMPMRQYLPRNPIPTPSYYPQAPLLNSDSLDFFGRLPIETLFFIFYYLEGTRAQYLAAKVLKKQSWRFHTKFMMWFQRHEEPKVINDSYEQGTYIYFDIEKWGQQKKDGFVFEYQYLEDRELN